MPTQEGAVLHPLFERGKGARDHASETIASGEARERVADALRGDCPVELIDHFVGSIKVDAHRRPEARNKKIKKDITSYSEFLILATPAPPRARLQGPPSAQSIHEEDRRELS